MEVILKEDVNNLGQRGDVVKVADGYGRNFLLPKKLAMEATAANKVVIEQMKQAAVRHFAREKSEAESLVTQLNQVELVFERKVGENDHLFGSVTSAEIAQQLVDGSFRPRLLIHAFDDHRAREGVLAVRGRQAAGHDDGARGHSAVEDLVALAVIDARALADEHTHGNHRARLDDDTLDDFRAGADEAVVLDDGGVRLQRLEHTADAHAA